MDGEKLNKEGLKKVWLKFWSLLKVIVGDVDVEGKGDLQTQINDIDQKVEECFQSASDGKKLVADAITGKGVLTAASDTFATMAGNISVIETGTDTSDASAVASNILEGRTAYVKDGRVTGTMTNEGAWTGETTGNSNVLIPEGYHNGRGYVSGSGAYNKGMSDADARANADSRNYKTGYDAGVAATKKGNAGAGDVLSGKTFTNASSVNEKGTMANKGGTTVDAGGVTQDDTYTYLTVPAAGYYNTNSKLRTANSNIVKKIGDYSNSSGSITIDVSHLPNYQNLTADNFLIIINNVSVGASRHNINRSDTNTYSGNLTPIKSYNNATGVLTISGLSLWSYSYVTTSWYASVYATITSISVYQI